LLKRGPQRAVQAILQVELAAPADDVREQVPVEGRVGCEHGMQVEHVLRGNELIKPDWPGRYLSPLTPGTGMVGVGAPIPDPLEDHSPSLKEHCACRRACDGPAARPGLRRHLMPTQRCWRAHSWLSISLPAEDSPSGLGRTLGKRVGGNPSRVRISHPPPRWLRKLLHSTCRTSWLAGEDRDGAGEDPVRPAADAAGRDAA
jgi:hypothetical protein